MDGQSVTDAVLKATDAVDDTSKDAVKEAVKKAGGEVVHEEHKTNVHNIDSSLPAGTMGTVVEQTDSYVIKADGDAVGDAASSVGIKTPSASAATKNVNVSGDHQNSGRSPQEQLGRTMHTEKDALKTTDTYSEQLMRADDEGMPPAEIKQISAKKVEKTTPSSSKSNSPVPSSPAKTSTAHSDVLSPPPPKSSPKYAELATGENEKESVLKAEILETLPPSMHHVRQFDAEHHVANEDKLVADHKQHQRDAAKEHRVGHMQTLDSGIFPSGEQAIPLSIERKENYSVTPHYLVDDNRDDDYLLNKTQQNNNNNQNRESADDAASAATSSSFEHIDISRGGSGFDSNNGFERVDSPRSATSPTKTTASSSTGHSYERNETAEVIDNKSDRHSTTTAKKGNDNARKGEKKTESREDRASTSSTSSAEEISADAQKQRGSSSVEKNTGGYADGKKNTGGESERTSKSNEFETAGSQYYQASDLRSSPTKNSTLKMTDYNSNSNRPQWNAAVSQDGAEVTRPEMNNLITGLDEDPFGERGGKQHVQQYTKTETTITTNKNNNAVNNNEDWEQAGGQRSPSGNKRESHQEQQYNSKTERTGATRQEEEDTAVRNRRNNQQSGGRREENLIDTEEQQSSYQQQQSPSHQQRKQGGQQREEQESASSYQRNQGGQQQQRQGSQQEEQESSYQRKQQGGQQQQRQGGQQEEQESSYQRKQQGGQQQQRQGGQQEEQESSYQRKQQGGQQEEQESSYQRKQQGGQQQQQGQEGEEQQTAQQRHEMERLRSRVQHSVTDVVMWRDVVHSAAVFGVGLGLLLLIIWMPVTQMILYALLLAQTVALALVGLKYFMTKVSNAEYHHPLENVILSETTINPDAAHRLLDSVLRVVNAQLVQLKRLVLAEDIGTTLKFAATCWALTYFSTWFSGLTLLFVAWVSLFTLPKIYTVYRQPIDRHVGTVRNQVGNLEQMIVQKVPQLRPLLTGRGIFAVSTQRQREEMNVNVNAGSPTRRGGPGGAGGQYAATSTTSTTTATSSANRNNRYR